MLSNNTVIEPLGTLTPGIAGNNGRRVTRPIRKGKKTLAFHVVVEGDVTPTTQNAAAIVDTGSILSIFAECGVNDGADRLLTTPLDMRYMTEAFSAKPVPSKRLTVLTAGTTTHLKEAFSIYCSPPWAANREEVTFMEHDPSGVCDFFIKQVADNAVLGTNAGALIATPGGGGTVVVSNVTVRVYQEYIRTGGKLPIFQPKWELATIPVTGTDHAFQFQHLKNFYLQGMLWRQEVVGVSRVGDILQNVKQARTAGKIIGDEMIAADDLQGLIDREFTGTVYTFGGVNPYVLFWYQRGGRLSKVLPPNDPNFISTLDIAQSATAGTSRIQVTYFMLDRDNTVRQDGSRVTLPADQLAATGLVI